MKEDWVGKKEADNVKLLSVGEVTSKIFDSARALAKNFKKGKSKITSKMIKQQLDIVEAYTLSKNKVYAIEYGSRSQSLYVVDSTNSTIVHFNIRVSDPSN